MIKEAYCSFEVSKLLKEKGFPQLLGDDGCVNRIPYYCSNGNLWTGDIGLLRQRYFHEASAPSHQMALEWLREEKNIVIEINLQDYMTTENGKLKKWYSYTIWTFIQLLGEKGLEDSRFNERTFWQENVEMGQTYEEAVEAALKFCLTKLI